MCASIIAITSLALSTSAHSQQEDWEIGPYIGGSLGLSRADEACEGIDDCSETAFAGKVFGGVEVGRYVSAELGYAYLGEISANEGGVDVDSDATSFFGAIIGQLPVADSGTVFAKVGYHRWPRDVFVEFSGVSGGIEDDGSDLLFGLGYRHAFEGGLGLRIEWERFLMEFETADADTDLFSVGVEYRF